MGCNLARILHKIKLKIKNNLNECFTSIALSLIVLLDIIQKFGLFLELLKTNFLFEIVIGERESDATFKKTLKIYYAVKFY